MKIFLKMKAIEYYIKYHKGDIPLIISVPHGGTLKPKSIPIRSNGVIGIDKNTINLALILIKKVKEIYRNNKSPSYVISNVHRSKIDLNKMRAIPILKELREEKGSSYYVRGGMLWRKNGRMP